jgi:hypothetical protein
MFPHFVGCCIWLAMVASRNGLRCRITATTAVYLARKSARINIDGSGEQYFNFSVPNQAIWQPEPIFPNGKRLIFLSMEPRRDVSGKPFEEYYTKTPTHLWIYDLEIRTAIRVSDKRPLPLHPCKSPFLRNHATQPKLIAGLYRFAVNKVDLH